ncbi:hypothetical protein [uncultured Alistipes sp.]|uniref:hypothetical protein n=1 Tax=uncultured Alistipes sp. TaxID=538949 RepID=UPI0026145649|nr:hypothetical protein [uncultured Alistipes sp.]
MKPNTDWTDAVRNALRDAEIPPPEDGWERLQRGLDTLEPVVSKPRKSVWRIYGLRIAAAAAVVLIGLVAGEILLRPTTELRMDGNVIASAGQEPGAAVAIPGVTSQEASSADDFRKSLAESVGLQTAAERLGTPARGEALAVAAKTRSAEVGHASVAVFAAEPSRAAEPGAQNAAEVRSTEESAGVSGPVPEPVPAHRETVSSDGERERRAAAQTAARTQHDAVATAESAPAVKAAEKTFRTRRQKRAASSVSLFAAGGMTGAANGLQAAPVRSYSVITNDAVSLIGNGNNFSPMQERDYDKSSFRHHLPLSFGLSFRREFAYGLSLDCGLNYTLLRSEVRLPYSSEEVSQTLHFVGVPLRLNWRFVERGAFSAYLGAGGMVEKCVAARLGSESVGEKALQWSLAAALGAQYRLGNHVALYFEPELSCYLTDTELRTSRTDTSPTLTLRLGMRFAF